MTPLLPEIPRILTAVAEGACCLVCISPLKKRFPLAATVILSGIALLIQCGLQLLAGSLPVSLWIVGMLINVCFMGLFIGVVSEVHLNQGIYWTAIAFIAAEFLASFEWQISCHIVREPKPGFDPVATLIAVPVMSGVLFLFSYVERKVKKLNELVRTQHTITTVILAIIAFTVSNLAFLNSQWRDSISGQFYVYFIRTLVDLCVLVILYLQQWTMQEHRYLDELSSIQNVLNLQYKQYLDYKESSEYISRQCHDLKHQINALRSACTNEERESYLQEMERAINQYNGQNVTGNAVLDTLLTQKKIYCLDHDIDFSMKANGKALSNLAVRDICTIVGNLLDNAIEYASGLEDTEQRHIQGEIYEKGAFLMIRIENYYLGAPVTEAHLPKTTKGDKTRHGYGLKSVRYIVEKYDGSMTIRTENNWFVVRVLIPISKQE